MNSKALESDAFLKWIGEQIAMRDRLVDESYRKGFPVDVEIYNSQAHLLRVVRDEYKRTRKEGN